MKVAICFSGLVRTFEECWPSYSRLLNKYECDIFGASSPNDVLTKHAFKKLLLQEDEFIDEKDYNQKKSKETSIQNTLRQFYFTELCNKLRIQYEEEKQIKYDWVIRTRFDNWMIDDIPILEQCDHNNMYIPLGNDHPMAQPGVGINDRFAFASNNQMNIYCNKLSCIPEFMQNNEFHPETILKWVLDRNKINIVRFNECTKIYRGNNEYL
jgi:hypothetical protein